MSKEQAIHTEQYQDHKIEIFYDSNPDNPRNWDNITEFHVMNSRYNLGEHQHGSKKEIDDVVRQAKKQHDLVLNLYAYIHSGIALSLESFHGKLPQGHAEFDSGQCGFVIIRRKKMLEEFGGKKWTNVLIEKAKELAKSDIDTFEAFLNGEVYGYVIDESKDSCWGYYSVEDATQEAKSIIDHIVEEEKESVGKGEGI